MGLRDIKHVIRSLAHDRGVSSIVILCLSLGIGVNAMLFALVDGILIQPLPYAEPERLFILNRSFERGGIRDAGVFGITRVIQSLLYVTATDPISFGGVSLFLRNE